MISNFNIGGLPKIHFGSKSSDKLKKEIGRFGKNIILITGKSAVTESEYGKQVIDTIKKNHTVLNIHKIVNEPSPANIDEIIRYYKSEKIDCVVAIGGGSVIDAGKAVSAMLPLQQPIKKYLEGVGDKTHPGTKLPFIALPTTAGTGSECTKNAVITEFGPNGFKRSLRHDNFVPNVAIVDPEFLRACPKNILAASGMDAFSQLLESYLSTQSNAFIDALAIDGLQKIGTSLATAYEEENNMHAKSRLAYGAMLSGITLANAGLGLVHGFASSVGGFINVPHGTLCGTLMASCNKFTLEALIDQNSEDVAVEKYARLGKLLSTVNYNNYQLLAVGFIEFLEKLTKELQIPKLKQFGLQEHMLDIIVSSTGQKNNPVKLKEAHLKAILQQQLVGEDSLS